MIPKTIHFIWAGPDCPEWARRNVKMFTDFNPAFAVQWHGEEVLLQCFRHAYNRIDGEHAWARRADVLRVCTLLRYGGWYWDVDFLPIRPLADLHRVYREFCRDGRQRMFLTQCAHHHETGDTIIANGVIAAEPNDPMLALIATGIMRAAETERELAWDAYGPGLYTTLVGMFPELVVLGEMRDFYPIQDHEESQAAYKRIAAAGYRFDVQHKELGDPMPHAFHVAMRGETEL